MDVQQRQMLECVYRALENGTWFHYPMDRRR
jgi:hypothetical protein